MIQFKKSFKKRSLNALSLSLTLAVLSGCSSMGSILDSTGEALSATGEAFHDVTGDVQVIQMEANVYDLTEFYHEPVKGFDSASMRSKARKVCNEGYIYRSRHATKPGELADNHAQCIEDQTCTYALTWRIECKKVPYEPFSLFGKT